MILTEEEKRILLGIIDVACKAGGISIARQCIYFYEKISKNENKTLEETVDKK